MHKATWLYYNLAMFALFFLCGAYLSTETAWSLFSALAGSILVMFRNDVKKAIFYLEN